MSFSRQKNRQISFFCHSIIPRTATIFPSQIRRGRPNRSTPRRRLPSARSYGPLPETEPAARPPQSPPLCPVLRSAPRDRASRPPPAVAAPLPRSPQPRQSTTSHARQNRTLIVNQAHCTKCMFVFGLIHTLHNNPHTYSPFLSPPATLHFTSKLSYAPSCPHYPHFSTCFSPFPPVG